MNLSNAQQALILEAMSLAGQVNTPASLDRLLDGPIKQLLNHEIVVCGIGVSLEKGCYGHKFHNRGFPLKYFDDLENPDGTVNSPLMKEWRGKRKPVFFQGGRDDAMYPADWVAIFKRHDLRNTIATAILDRRDVISNFFIFARLKNEVGPEQAHILDLLTPNLCFALVRALEAVECEGIFAGAVHAVFSRKQREVLHWIYQGKTNWEIAKILDMNAETVKYHIDQTMQKLGVKTRAQAVGKALEIGIISSHKL
ncbi:MAG TPA: helix-turn-helix transcriptional regulator [Burkholderiaceae bacterium]|jgi:transcriptional regulator EpsA